MQEYDSARKMIDCEWRTIVRAGRRITIAEARKLALNTFELCERLRKEQREMDARESMDQASEPQEKGRARRNIRLDADLMVSRIFAQCLCAYHRCNAGIQQLILEMATLSADPTAPDDVKEVAIATIAEALFLAEEDGADRDTGFLPDDALIELRDATIDAHREGKTVEFRKMGE